MPKDKGKGKAIDYSEQEENTDTDNALLEYFSNLIEKRDALQSEYERANKLCNKTNLDEHTAYMDYIGKQLDGIQNEIDDLVDQSGFIDPAEDETEEEDSENDKPK